MESETERQEKRGRVRSTPWLSVQTDNENDW